MDAGEITYRGFILTPTFVAPHWQVVTEPIAPDARAQNLPFCQGDDRDTAVELARSLIDRALDGPALGELTG